MKRRLVVPIGLLALIAVVVAGCGSSYGGGNGKSATAASTPSAKGGTSAIATRKGEHGTYLVDGKGRTLYLFEADKTNKSNCDSACLSIWPAFKASGSAPSVSGGAVAGKLGTAPGSNGRLVTYNGHPLYYYVGDKKPGDTSGQGLNQFGAKWYVLNPAGDKIDDD